MNKTSICNIYFEIKTVDGIITYNALVCFSFYVCVHKYKHIIQNTVEELIHFLKQKLGKY